MARILIHDDPFVKLNDSQSWEARGAWPCAWITCPTAGDPPFVAAYRRTFALPQAAVVRVHVSADERYDLFVDGERVGCGPERGDARHWFFESYDLELAAGAHTLVARVWSLGPARSPVAQMTVHPGFILAPEAPFTDMLGTGVAPWECKRLDGYSFMDPDPTWGTGWNQDVDGSRFAWGFEHGAGADWLPSETLKPGMGLMTDRSFHGQHRLMPATLPAMLHNALPRPTGTVRLVWESPSVDAWGYDAAPLHAATHLPEEAAPWNALLAGEAAITVPPNTLRQVIIDLGNYYCAYPEIVTSGGAGSVLRVLWEESMRPEPDPWNIARGKGHRDEIEDKFFVGTGDTLRPDGGQQRRFDTLWWQAGRYVALLIQTAGEPLTIERFTLYETRYPLENDSTFAASDPRLAGLIPILVRGLQMCAHETYFDCPYYEQLMYAGDTRLEVLATYVTALDDRLPRKALTTFDYSRHENGLTQARYPNREFQEIPSFSLWWAAMVHDYALWRDDVAFVQARMPGVRGVLESYRALMGEDGFLRIDDGWPFFDWVPEWSNGNPPGAEGGISGALNWQYALVAMRMAALETALGETHLAARYRQHAQIMATRLEAFWDEARGLYADDVDHQHFSEHTQCMAVLSGLVDAARCARLADGLLHAPDLSRTTIYFTHYLFETYRELGLIDALLARMALWYTQQDYGACTPIEKPEPSRSDCHAWGSHPLYHYFASILGVRPAGLGFRTVAVWPQLGALTHASGTMPHPQGEISVDVRREGDVLHGTVTLPADVTGTLYVNGAEHALIGGEQTF